MRYSENFAHQHANGKSCWHFEWCTKYRYRLFKSDYNKNLCRIALAEAAKLAKVAISEMEVQPEHVHMIAELPLTKAPVKAVGQLKSVSAKILFAELPKLRKRYPKNELWSRGKFMATVGNITLEKAKEYVKNQETHHAKLNWNPRPEAKRRGRPQRSRALPRGGCQYNIFLTFCNFSYILQSYLTIIKGNMPHSGDTRFYFFQGWVIQFSVSFNSYIN
jgi:putative transposase